MKAWYQVGFEPINETKYLVLGINPSNSFNKVNSVIQKSDDKWFLENLKVKEYDLFSLMKMKNRLPTQELSHEHHHHFKNKTFLI